MAAKAENAFTLEALQLIIDKYGKRVRCLTTPYTKILCNMDHFSIPSNIPYIDTDNLVAWDASGYEVLECRNWDASTQKMCTTIIRVEYIVSVTIVDNINDYIDPFRM